MKSFLTYGKEESKIEEALRSLGYTRNLARTFIYFFNNEQGFSEDIERAMNLRQPEVSISTKEMKLMNFLNEKQKKTCSKGRPKKLFTLCGSKKELLEHIIQEKEIKIEEEKELIGVLRDYLMKVEQHEPTQE